MDNLYNVTTTLTDLATRLSQQTAIWYPDGRTADGKVRYSYLTFDQLEERVNRCANRLLQHGIQPGQRTLLLIQPDMQFILAVLALLRLGAVPVFIEPAMGLKPLQRCLNDANPSALLAPPTLQVFTFLFPTAFRNLCKRLLPQQVFAPHPPGTNPTPIPITTNVDSEAIISFTSGSTGVPKGMIYRHGMLHAQMQTIQKTFGIVEGESGMFDLSAFALAALMLGVTIILPELKRVRQPGPLDAQFFVETARFFKVQSTFASPANLQHILDYCAEHHIHLSGLKRVLLGGAPVHAHRLRALHSILPDGDGYVSLGATEITPIAAITATEALQDPQPTGALAGSACVGFPCPSNRVSIIPISDTVVGQWQDELELPPGEVGEIVVQSPFAIEGYLSRPAETTLARIESPDGHFHRSGDLGYLDERDRLWFVGRKSHRVETLRQTFFPLPCEAVFNTHPAVVRSALVKIISASGEPMPGIVIELCSTASKKLLQQELLALAATQEHTHAIQHIFFYPKALPTDIRHHSKILRDRLSGWAQACFNVQERGRKS